MQIYFGFTVAGNRSSVEAARRMVNLLEAMGHRVLTRHLVQDDAWESDRLITRRMFTRETCGGFRNATAL